MFTLFIMPKIIDKLNDTNYPDWVIKMEALLEEKDLWGVVSGEEKQPSDSKSAKAYQKKLHLARTKIILHVKNLQLPHTHDSHPKIVWDNLACVHCSHGFRTLITMHCCFFSMEKGGDVSMQAWIASVCHAAFQLEAANFDNSGLKLTD
jgi:hypothetical protein